MEPYYSALISLAFFCSNVLILLLILYWNRQKPAAKPPKPGPPTMPPAPTVEPFLEPGEILGWEFDYASKTASESMQDRHTMVNFYLIITGVVASGVIGLLSSNTDLPTADGTVLLWVLCLVGWLYLLKLIRLREAWYDSALAMNEIKKFYIQHAKQLPAGLLRTAFYFKPETLPRPDKKWTVFFYSASLLGLLNSVAFVIGGVLLNPSALVASPWVGGVIVLLGLGMFIFNEWLYFALLKLKTEAGVKAPSSIPGSSSPGKDVSATNIGISGASTDPLRNQNSGDIMFEWKKSPAVQDSEGLVKVHEETVDYQFGSLFRIVRASLQYRRFDGRMSEEINRINFERGDSVGILLYNPNQDEVALVRQFRYPVYASLSPSERQGEGARQGWILETVAGVQDVGLSVLQVANKELLEEAGIVVKGELQPITQFYVSPGGTSEMIRLFLGEVEERQQANTEFGVTAEGEDTQVVVISFKTAMEMVARGEINDGKTIIALQYLALKKNQSSSSTH